MKEGEKAEARRAARRQRSIAWGAALLVLVFVALAGWALWSRDQAQSAYQIAATAQAEAEIQALAIQDGLDTAILLQGRESVARSHAEANATAASAAKATAEAASTKAVAGEATAQAANTAQVKALNDLAANLQTNLTAQAAAMQPPSPASTATAETTPTGTPTSAAITLGTPTNAPLPKPPGTPVATSTMKPRPTPNRTVIAQQTQLSQVRATQTTLARPAKVRPTATSVPVVCTAQPTGEFETIWRKYIDRLGCPTPGQTNRLRQLRRATVRARFHAVVTVPSRSQWHDRGSCPGQQPELVRAVWMVFCLRQLHLRAAICASCQPLSAQKWLRGRVV